MSITKLLVAFSASSLLLLSACGDSEKPSNAESGPAIDCGMPNCWSAADKTKARRLLRRGIGDVEKTLVNRFGNTAGKEIADAIIDCIVDKAEANYDSLAATDRDVPGMETIGFDCAYRLTSP